jgi:transcriptional adapter 2-alpha
MELANETTREEFQARKKRRIEERRDAAKNAPTLQPKTKPTASVPSCHEVQGYMPGRLEFETEYANDAEEAVQLMQFDLSKTGDTESELDLKLTVMEVYNCRLTQRVERKKVIFEHNLLDYRENQKLEKKRTKEERDMVNKAKALARIMDRKDFDDFCQGLIDEYNLRLAIGQLQEWRSRRIGDLRSGEKYELEKAVRQQKSVPMGTLDRDRLAMSQRSKGAAAPEPPPGSSLLVGPELPSRIAQSIAVVRGEAVDEPAPQVQTNGVPNGVTTGAAMRQKYIPQPAAGLQPIVLHPETAPDLQLLTPEEVRLCEVVRLQPKPYLMIKEQILKEALKGNGAIKKKHAREICRLESQKGGKIFDFFVNAGWVARA